ncbi:MAG: methylenetetrahydrofolate reductase C-terminal domain-containing protein [Promethearchaeota archaeon]
MIISKKKDFEELKAAIDLYGKNVFVVGCGSCAALCQVGGTKQVKEMVEKLGEAGYEVTGSAVLEEVCDNRLVKKELKRGAKEEIAKADVLLSLSCGIGGQSLVEIIPEKAMVQGTDTIFMGMTERIGRWYAKCRACGQCFLNETGGICPITNCAKSMLNGPCGGTVGGKCEANNYEDPCGWIMIYNRLKELGKLDLYTKYREPLDWTEIGKQQKLIFR